MGNAVLFSNSEYEGMIKELMQGKSLGLVVDQALPDEILEILGQTSVKIINLPADFVNQLLLGR